jgi:hypothetical protein
MTVEPLDYVYVSPDVASEAAELAHPPRVIAGPDGALLLYTFNDAGERHGGERVIKIDRFPPFALVQVLEAGPPDDPYDPPATIGYLVRIDALPDEP